MLIYSIFTGKHKWNSVDVKVFKAHSTLFFFLVSAKSWILIWHFSYIKVLLLSFKLFLRIQGFGLLYICSSIGSFSRVGHCLDKHQLESFKHFVAIVSRYIGTLVWASDEWWSIFSCGVVSWCIQVLASAMSPEQVPSAETFFPHQNVTSTWFEEFWVLKPLSTEVWL